MGEAQMIPYDELLEEAFARFEEADDFTVAVEEEFALLDPQTLDLVNRFEDMQNAARGTNLAPHLAGELIASEIEVKTGRCDSFAEVSRTLALRREQLRALVEPLGVVLGTTGTHPWASWKDQRIIDTPHYRRNNEILQYVVWRNNTFGFHAHVAIRGADRAIAVTRALRSFLPELLAVSCSSPLIEGVNSGLHSARTQIFTRFFPRCGVPDAFASWDEFVGFVRFLYETRSIDEHTQLWWSIRPHLAFPTVEIRISDAQPDIGDAQALAALSLSLAARVARALDEGEPLPTHPNRLIEENLWRAIRYGLSGELIDFARGTVLPARARIEQLIEWVMPVAEEIGTSTGLRVPAATSAERQIALHAQGVDLPEIYASENSLYLERRVVSS